MAQSPAYSHRRFAAPRRVAGSRLRTWLTGAAALLLGALALWFAARGVNRGQLSDTFQHVGWWWVAGAVAANVCNVVAQGWAWQLGLRAGGVGDVHMRHTIGATWIGKAGNQLLPAKVGEIARVAVVRRHTTGGPGQLPRIIGSLVAQRILALVATLVIVVVSALALPLPVTVPGGRAGPLLAVIAVVAVGLAAWRTGAARYLRRGVPRRVRGLAENLAGGAGLLRPSRDAGRALGLHTVAIGAQLVTMAMLLHAFSISAPVSAPLMIVALVAIAGAVPGAPGGLGVNQAAIVMPLGVSYGVSASSALAFSLGLQATIAAVAVVGGLAALVHQRMTVTTFGQVAAKA
jgi:glycosyltransferase 2 family protein